MGLEGRRLWSREEDRLLLKHIEIHGEGLNRNAKSCRFRWTRYLHPELNSSVFSSDEEDLIVRMHKLIGNRWSLIAGRLPGRTALAVKNHWNTTMRKKILHHHCHVVKHHCTCSAGFSPSHHNEKTKGLSSDSFLKSEGQRHNSHDGPHISHGIAEAETKSTVNAETKSQLHPLHDIDRGCMIPPDPGSLSAIINSIMQQEEDNLSQQYNFTSDDELICMAAGMPSTIEDEIHLWEVNAEEPFSLWQSSLYHI